MEIVDGTALLFQPADPDAITQAIRKSHKLDDGRVLVHWNLAAMRALARLGYDVPSPIKKNYPYHGKNAPYSHQKRMSEFMTLHKRCFNFSDMGTGKSRAVCWAVDYLMQVGDIKRVLIVAPLSILRSAWESDLSATAIHRSVDIARGTPEKRRKIILSGCEFCIINHDGIKSSFKDLQAANFDLIVVDEATAFSNARSDRWKALHKLIKPTTGLWLLTGTPAANSPLQAYGLAKLICPERVPQFFSGWRDLTMTKLSMFTYIPRPNARDIVYGALQPAIRFDKRDCLDLPPVTFVEREVPMDPGQQQYYDNMRSLMAMLAAEKTVTAVNKGVLVGKLLQIASGAVYSDDGSVINFRAQNRLNDMWEVIKEAPQKVLVFAQYRHTIRMIEKFLTEHNIECATIDGDTADAERGRIIHAFQTTPAYRVLVLQPKVASHGITLTAASTTIWFSPVSSLETWRQANDRINRIGQQNKMTVVKMVGSSVEQRAYKILERRDAEQTDLLELYREELEA